MDKLVVKFGQKKRLRLVKLCSKIIHKFQGELSSGTRNVKVEPEVLQWRIDESPY